MSTVFDQFVANAEEEYRKRVKLAINRVKKDIGDNNEISLMIEYNSVKVVVKDDNGTAKSWVYIDQYESVEAIYEKLLKMVTDLIEDCL